MNCVSGPEPRFLVVWDKIKPTNTVLIFLEAVSSLELSCIAKFSQIQGCWLLSAYNEDKRLEETFCRTQAKNKKFPG